MDEAEDERGRVGIREVDEVRSRGWVVEEEGQKVCRRQGASGVCVREDEGAGGKSALCRGGYSDNCAAYLWSSKMCRASMTPFMVVFVDSVASWELGGVVWLPGRGAPPLETTDAIRGESTEADGRFGRAVRRGIK